MVSITGHATATAAGGDVVTVRSSPGVSAAVRAAELQRIPRRDEVCMVPRPLGDGRVEVDVTWGTVQPMEVARGVCTIGELELVEHLERGLPVIDTRQRRFHEDATIPTASGIPHEQILDHLDELDPGTPTVLFCNGPQCRATPDAIRRLLDGGYPPTALRYYRGGMHDWMTLGYPTVPGLARRPSPRRPRNPRWAASHRR